MLKRSQVVVTGPFRNIILSEIRLLRFTLRDRMHLSWEFCSGDGYQPWRARIARGTQAGAAKGCILVNG